MGRVRVEPFRCFQVSKMARPRMENKSRRTALQLSGHALLASPRVFLRKRDNHHAFYFGTYIEAQQTAWNVPCVALTIVGRLSIAPSHL